MSEGLVIFLELVFAFGSVALLIFGRDLLSDFLISMELRRAHKPSKYQQELQRQRKMEKKESQQ